MSNTETEQPRPQPSDDPEVLTQKMISNIFNDLDLCFEVGIVVRDLVVIPSVERGELSKEQFDRILDVMDKTMALPFTEEQLEKMEGEARRRVGEESEFIHFGH